jgi:hypothetical protein
MPAGIPVPAGTSFFHWRMTMDQQKLDRLMQRIRHDLGAMNLPSISSDEANMLAEMGGDKTKLRQVLDSFSDREPRPGILEIYQRFCGGVQ